MRPETSSDFRTFGVTSEYITGMFQVMQIGGESRACRPEFATDAGQCTHPLAMPAKVFFPRRSTENRPCSNGPTNASADATFTLFTYTPPCAIARRASLGTALLAGALLTGRYCYRGQAP